MWGRFHWGGKKFILFSYSADYISAVRKENKPQIPQVFADTIED
jgi:hypothetical protein